MCSYKEKIFSLLSVLVMRLTRRYKSEIAKWLLVRLHFILVLLNNLHSIVLDEIRHVVWKWIIWREMKKKTLHE